MAFRAQEPAIRWRRCVGNRRLSRRGFLPCIHASEAGVRSAADRGIEAPASALRRGIRESAGVAEAVEWVAKTAADGPEADGRHLRTSLHRPRLTLTPRPPEVSTCLRRAAGSKAACPWAS